MRTGTWLEKLARVGLRETSLSGLAALVSVICDALSAEAAIVWEAQETSTDERPDMPAALVACSRSGAPHELYAVHPDPLTLSALSSGATQIPDETGMEPSADLHARCSMPLTFWDGRRGAVTIYRSMPWDSTSTDRLAELTEILPGLLRIIRDRQALALVTSCNDILHQADLESPDDPLGEARLSLYLGRLCQEIATSIGCLSTDIYLDIRPQSAPLTLRASSDPTRTTGEPLPQRYESATSTARSQVVVDHSTAMGLRPESEPPTLPSVSMIVPIMTGQALWGVIVCSGAAGWPYRFSHEDLPLIEPIASQVAQYWSNWLARREMQFENAAWRELARGLTDLNRTIHDELGRRRPSDEAVFSAALDLLLRVVPAVDGVSIRQASKAPPRHLLFSATGGSGWKRLVGDQMDRVLGHTFPIEPPTSSPGARAFREQRQLTVDEETPIEIGGAGVATVRWLVTTPMRAGSDTYGVIDAFRIEPDPELPEILPDVANIVGDQLGLYLNLKDTLQQLRHIEAELKGNIKAQSQAFEDLEHQLVSPLLSASLRADAVLIGGRLESRTEGSIKAIRGLCRRASRVALSAGVFAQLSRGERLRPRIDHLGQEDLIPLLIAAADDTQLLGDPDRRIRFVVDRDSIRQMGRRLILVDRSFLEQCIGNVLDNAAKYSYEDTTVVVAGQVSSDEICVIVANEGLPLSPVEAARCTERNWRSAAAKSTTGEGSGLGLWIVDALMRSMGGALTVHPEDEITTVTLCLPLR